MASNLTNLESPRLIAIYADSMSSGKSEVASILIGHGYERVKFADPLKAMVRGLYRWRGYGTETIEAMLEGDLKETPNLDFAGASPRVLMQTLGTEWGRNTIHQQFWTMLAEGRILDALDAGRRVVIDDIRFPNEAALVRSLGGSVIRVYRPETTAINGHLSEGNLSEYPFDATILNDADLVTLRQRTVAALRLEG